VTALRVYEPPVSLGTISNLIGATKTRSGLKVCLGSRTAASRTKIKVPDAS
jgi:hypothetical protein